MRQRIDAPPSVVYRFLTESDKWVRWQGEAAILDPRVGGVFSMTMGDGSTARGRFIELVADRRVVFSWGWLDRPGIPPGSTVVDIELIADGDGTLVVLTHRSMPPDEVRPHEMGWAHYLPRLATAAEGGSPTRDSGPG
ncbi:MAG: SRPBCC domain-containing protein [Acidimicrobiia bacterium]